MGFANHKVSMGRWEGLVGWKCMGGEDVGMDVELWTAAKGRRFWCCGWAFGVGWVHGKSRRMRSGMRERLRRGIGARLGGYDISDAWQDR